MAQAIAGPAVTMAAIFDGVSTDELLDTAVRRFRAISWETLRAHPDIICRGGGLDVMGAGAADLHTLSCTCLLGNCDAFWSHSWHDNADLKWAAITAWADAFRRDRGRWPTLWLDKVCIEQTAVQDDLRCLPIFLAGCNRLVITCGATYTQRLWCCLELFVHMLMQTDAMVELQAEEIGKGSLRFGSIRLSTALGARASGTSMGWLGRSDIRRVPSGTILASSGPTGSLSGIRRGLSRTSTVSDGPTKRQQLPEVILLGAAEDQHEAKLAWHGFDVRACRCFAPGDKVRMMNVVEQGNGGVDSFNDFIKKLTGRLFADVVLPLETLASVTSGEAADAEGAAAGLNVRQDGVKDGQGSPIFSDSHQAPVPSAHRPASDGYNPDALGDPLHEQRALPDRSHRRVFRI